MTAMIGIDPYEASHTAVAIDGDEVMLDVLRVRASKAQTRTSMAGKFELYKDKAGKFRFRLKASNGQIIAVGVRTGHRTRGRLHEH